MTSDLHMHPLCHKYFDQYYEISDFRRVVLDDEDKQNIRAVVDWCCHKRRLVAIALTDHDMIQASLYAKEYAQEAALPIEIITGAECSVYDPHIDFEIHLLCLGVEKLPKYKTETTVDRMISAVHDMGGYVIMSHPIIYPDSFFRYCRLLDGYEYRNGDRPPFDEGKEYLAEHGISLRAYCNSDFHYEGVLEEPGSSLLQRNVFESSPY